MLKGDDYKYKNLTKTMIVIWSLIALALIALLVYSISSGKQIWNGFGIRNLENESLTVQKKDSASIDEVNKIKVDFGSAYVEIISTDNSNVEVVQSANRKLRENEKFTMSKEGNTISIKNNKLHFGFGFLNFNSNEKIEVYIPKNYNKDLSVNLASGDIDINTDLTLNDVSYTQSSGDFNSNGNITANEILLKSTSGDININELSVKSYDINQVSGDTEIKSLSGSGKIKDISGGLKIYYKDISDYSDLNVVSGDVKLFIPKDISFQFDGKCISGDINSDFDINYKDKKGESASAKVGDGPYKKISVNSTSGDIDINRK